MRFQMKTVAGLLFLMGAQGVFAQASCPTIAPGMGVAVVKYTVPPPSNTQATDGVHVGRVDISWGAVAPGAKYVVYRDGSAITSISGISETSYSDTTVSGYTTYTYTVRAKIDGGTSNAGVADTGYGKPDGSTLLKLQATDGTITNRVDLSWQKATNAAGYKIYRDNVLLATIDGENTLTYSDTSVSGDATVRTYAVTAWKDASETSRSENTGYANVAPSAMTGTFTAPPGMKSKFMPVVQDGNAGDAFTFTIVSQGTKGVAEATAGGFFYTPNAGASGEDVVTIRVTDAAGAYLDWAAPVMVDCPDPTFLGGAIDGSLKEFQGVVKIDPCSVPADMKVNMEVLRGSTPVLVDPALAIQLMNGTTKQFLFKKNIESLPAGSYTVKVTTVDALGQTGSSSYPAVLDWDAPAGGSYTYQGAAVTGTVTVESFGSVGVK